MCQFEADPHELNYAGHLKLTGRIFRIKIKEFAHYMKLFFLQRNYFYCGLLMQAEMGAYKYLKIR